MPLALGPKATEQCAGRTQARRLGARLLMAGDALAEENQAASNSDVAWPQDPETCARGEHVLA